MPQGSSGFNNRPILLLDKENVAILDFKGAGTLNSAFCSVLSGEPDDVFARVPDVFPSMSHHLGYPAMPANQIISSKQFLSIVTSSAGTDCIN